MSTSAGLESTARIAQVVDERLEQGGIFVGFDELRSNQSAGPLETLLTEPYLKPET